MPRPQSNGKCLLCKGTFRERGMTRHLQSCLREEAQAGEPAPKAARQTRLLHLVVEGRYLPEYWLHLEVRADAKLYGLDSFLRRIWLECCGHLSAFEIDGESCDVGGPDAMGADVFGAPSHGMDVSLGRVLGSGMQFLYQYDFGSTTHLTLRVAGERQGKARREPIRLLARNAPPETPCGVCGKSATRLCVECSYEPDGWLCDACAPKHECGEDMFLPVVNSPRVGVCGYMGEAGDLWQSSTS